MYFGFVRVSVNGNIAGNTEKECKVLKKINAEELYCTFAEPLLQSRRCSSQTLGARISYYMNNPIRFEASSIFHSSVDAFLKLDMIFSAVISTVCFSCVWFISSISCHI